MKRCFKRLFGFFAALENWRIGEMDNSIFDVTNTLHLTFWTKDLKEMNDLKHLPFVIKTKQYFLSPFRFFIRKKSQTTTIIHVVTSVLLLPLLIIWNTLVQGVMDRTYHNKIVQAKISRISSWNKNGLGTRVNSS